MGHKELEMSAPTLSFTFPFEDALFGVLKQILPGSSSYVGTKPCCLSEVIGLEPVLSIKTREL